MLTLYPLALGMVCYQLAIKLAQHKRTLRDLSRTDSLTGLLNHGAWKDQLHARFELCRQNHTQAILALIDIDHFKSINDNYGHIVGDAVLSQLSGELKGMVSKSERAGRYGGDEFCLILPDQPLKKAEAANGTIASGTGSIPSSGCAGTAGQPEYRSGAVSAVVPRRTGLAG